MILIQTLRAFPEDFWPLTRWERGRCNPIMVTAAANGWQGRQRTHTQKKKQGNVRMSQHTMFTQFVDDV